MLLGAGMARQCRQAVAWNQSRLVMAWDPRPLELWHASLHAAAPAPARTVPRESRASGQAPQARLEMHSATPHLQPPWKPFAYSSP